jgi:hypothetical protein
LSIIPHFGQTPEDDLDAFFVADNFTGVFKENLPWSYFPNESFEGKPHSTGGTVDDAFSF